MSDKIYTRQGDDGATGRPGGQRVRKCDDHIDAVGTVDELSSVIGLCLAGAGQGWPIAAALATIQQRLFAVSSVLAVVGTDAESMALPADCAADLERAIDAAAEQLPSLDHFIAPGGCELAARLHVARTVCRRTERRVVALADSGQMVPPLVLQYLNRLSDWLFMLARMANKLAGQSDTPLGA